MPAYHARVRNAFVQKNMYIHVYIFFSYIPGYGPDKLSTQISALIFRTKISLFRAYLAWVQNKGTIWVRSGAYHKLLVRYNGVPYARDTVSRTAVPYIARTVYNSAYRNMQRGMQQQITFFVSCWDIS